MPNVVTEHLDPRPVALGPVDGVEALVAFAGADTYAKGTLLGRKVTSADSYVGAITGTGTRVPTLTARPGKTLKVGTYTLTAGTLTSGAGAWTMTDPDGQTQTYTTSAAGEDMEFPNLGVDVAIADTGTNFATSDEVEFTVLAASGKPLYAPYSPTGTNGAANPNAVLLDALTRASAGNEPARPIVRGDVNLDLLVIDGGGSVGLDTIDKLRVNGIYPWKAGELGKYDNTAPTPTP